MRGAIGPLRCRVLAVLASLCAAPVTAQAQPVTACPPTVALDGPIARAAGRFTIPDTLIRAVIAVESGGKLFAVSAKGAMGLMQLMPGTWTELRLRYALGADPFDPCDNIFAGTAYLRELLDRYGDPGFLAAYNAGPGRYEAYLRGRPLPAETVAYVARLSGRMVDRGASIPRRPSPDPDAWRHGGLFARAPEIVVSQGAEPDKSSTSEPQDRIESRPSEPARDTVFVPRTGAPK